jgi:antirestriction protein ArdC
MTVLTTDKNDVLEALSQGVAALQDSESWIEYLKMSTRFRQYSFQNTMLIALQNPEATRVAGFRAWQKLGRNVRKGEKGIRILAPSTRKDDDENTVVTGFRVVSVFDISQTDGDELPEMPISLLDGDDDAGLYDRLAAVVTEWDWRLEDVDDLGGVNGSCSHSIRTIKVMRDRTAIQRIKTLAHELGHARLHGPGDETPAAIREVEAESVAFTVCTALGISSDGYSFPYIASWASSSGDDATAIIARSAARIKETSNLIINIVNNHDAAEGTSTR